MVQHLACLSRARLVQRLLGFVAAKFDRVLIGLRAFLRALTRLADLVEIDGLAHVSFGPINRSGRTTSSNVYSSTNPRFTASSFNVVPFLCAVLATLVALSYPIVGARAVTSIRLSRISFSIRASLACTPLSIRSVKLSAASPKSCMDCNRL